MIEKEKAVLVAENRQISKAIISETRELADFVKQINDPRKSYKPIKEVCPAFVIIQADSMPDEAVALARRLKQTLPNLLIFFAARNKKADLILNGLRAGVCDYISISDDTGKISSIVQRAMEKNRETETRGRVIGIFGPRGGLGVTTVAINLADQINRITGDRTIVCDTGLHINDIGVFCGIACQYTHFQILNDMKRMDDDLLFSSLSRHPNGFYILTTTDEVSDVEEISAEKVSDIVPVLSRYLEYVILDLPHDFSEKNLAAIDQCDILIMLTQQFIPTIKSTQKALAFFDEIGILEKKIKLVINRYETKNELNADDMASILQQPIFASIKNDFRSISNSINKGKMLNDLYPEKGINRDIQLLTSLITGILPEKSNKNWWRRILSI